MKAMQNDHHLPDQVEEITSTAGRTIWKLATDLVSQEKESLGKAFREREAQILAREDNLKAEIRRFEDQVKELMQSGDEQRLALEHTISDLQVTLDARKDEVSRLQQQLQMVTHRYEDAGRLLEERGKEILEKSDQSAALNMGMADANALLERSLKEGEDKERRIDHLQQELDGQEQTIRQQDGRLADLHDRLTQTERVVKLGTSWSIAWDAGDPTCRPSLANCQGTCVCLLYLALAPPAQPTPFPGGWAHLDPATALFLTGFPGAVSSALSLPVPPNLALSGLPISAQVMLDSGEPSGPVFAVLIP